MKTITIHGGFHSAGTITLRVKDDPKGGIEFSPGQAKRLLRHMCGITGCICDVHHGWVIEGANRGEVTEALYHAQREAERRSWAPKGSRA